MKHEIIKTLLYNYITDLKPTEWGLGPREGRRAGAEDGDEPTVLHTARCSRLSVKAQNIYYKQREIITACFLTR